MIGSYNLRNIVCDVPALRFPEFIKSWECSILEKLSKKIGDGIHSTPSYDDNGTFYFINGNNLNGGKIVITSSTKRVSEKEAYKNNAENLEANSILMSINGTIGNVALYHNEPIMLGKSACYINSKDNIDKNYLFYYLQYPKTQLYFEAELTGTTIKNLSLQSIRKTKIYIPTIEEQHKISRFLQKIDERISTQNKIIEKYESLIQAMCDTLVEQETQQVTLSFSDFGQSYLGLSGKSAEDFGEGYPFITYMNVYQNQIIDLTDVGLVKINETEQQSVVRYGDILLTLSSETPEEVGMGAVYLGETYPLYLNSFCFGIHITDESKIYPPFLAYYVSSQSFRKAVYPLAQGSTRFNLQKSDFMKKKFSFPVIEKQRKIYSTLKTYSDKLIVEKQIMRLLCNQKCYLLRQLFI
ncbi:restriction endonuclease subunit S [Phocaeicola vulgatus]|uniref:Restriction endonuclease subunit S n=2 Tax=Bacteroidia TaxID=200643 RepID=A0A413JYE0_BACFG|nr:restriction endonuclease subunit S [Bacteroides fragilis]RHB88312.1 restriction endonuclease subunit S [Phocaeicola vulgatus]